MHQLATTLQGPLLHPQQEVHEASFFPMEGYELYSLMRVWEMLGCRSVHSGPLLLNPVMGKL